MNFVGFAGRLVWVGITQDELHFTQPLDAPPRDDDAGEPQRVAA